MAKFSQSLVNRLIRIYESGLRFLLKSKVRCIATIVLSCTTLFLLLIFVAPKITREIIATPKSNRISIRCSNNTIKDIEEFLRAMETIEQKIIDTLGERVISRYTNIRGTNWANTIVVLPSSKYLDDALDDLKDAIQNDSEWTFTINGWDPSSLPLPHTYGLHIQISGKDNMEIMHIMEKISDLVQKENLYRSTSTSPSTRQSNEIMLLPRRNELEHFPEFSISKLASMIKILLNGTQVIKVTENNQTLYINLEYPEDEGRSIEDIMKYQLPYKNKSFPFSHFFDYEQRRGISEIRSDNGSETFNVYAYMNRGTPDYKKSEFEAIIKQKIKEEIELPPGYSINFVDTQKVINEAVSSLFSTIIICVILIYMVLGIQFNSLRIPTIILTSIPLGLIGVITFLFFAHSTISLNSLLGTILLSGIVVNNAIIIIDFYIAYRDKYETRQEALVMVGRLRFTPILITTMTTLLGMLPIALAFGDSTNIVQPLGISVCGGLVVSTFLTLLLLPAILNLLPEKMIIKSYKN
jgi:HAE1 family hydrophobic/amphiphilic exporter-1